MHATRYVTPLREGGSLPGIIEADDLVDVPVPDRLLAGRILWLDALRANVDRCWRNSNLLIWRGDLFAPSAA